MEPQAVILIISFALLLALNVPVAVAIGLSTWLAMLTISELPVNSTIAERLAGGIESFPLLAIPFFILAGNLMGEGGLARRLMNFAKALVGPLRGGLAYVNVLTCMMFGAISGSAGAAVSSIGGFMLPEMNKAGYDKHFNVAITATAATTGLLIPPSNVMIVYAVVAQNVSIAALFLAGVVPGILVGLCLMGVSAIICITKGYGAGSPYSLTTLYKSFLGALPAMVLIVIVLGGILGGLFSEKAIFSPTEASAIAVAYGFILGVFFYREISLKRLHIILLNSAKTTAIVLFLVGASQAMSWLLARQMIPQAVSDIMLGLSNEKVMVLLLINVILLIVGMFMDMTPAVLIFTPIFLPVVMKLGVDPVHFGIIMIANLCIGLCTPPVGTCLFLGCSIGKTRIVPVAWAMLPLFMAMIIALMIITYWPAVSLWLPSMVPSVYQAGN